MSFARLISHSKLPTTTELLILLRLIYQTKIILFLNHSKVKVLKSFTLSIPKKWEVLEIKKSRLEEEQIVMSELLMIFPCLEVTLLFAKPPLEITTCVTIILNSEPCFWFNIQYLLDQSLKIDHLFCNLVKPVWAWCYNKELSSVEISIEYLNHAANAWKRTIPRKLNI